MPQTRKETEPLTERIGVRVTAGEKARLREDAALASLSVSELVRRRYFGRPILARADQAMVRELRRLGGLLKLWLTDDARTARFGADTILALLGKIEATQDKMSGIMEGVVRPRGGQL